ncbi:ATP synthase F1 subunit delta [Paludisphaera mucosa]|uniref:ATP synthase subunit delta n=1 Tax=Paludisphaera mucosa TaxID=3030827 RepID=A0ABT6FGC7_9BACT|nr:ATP synthase F1 subunit delta [Paludisphaera mucosa]MDG3006587.1 ATP synthase F1 subunit delta [Paludisphaera mucosa]
MTTQSPPERPRRPLGDDDAQAARAYAGALLGAAGAGDGPAAAIADLDAIRDEILDPNPRFAAVLASPQVATAEKDRILRELLDGRVSDVALRFLRVLNRHGRLGLIAGVADEARRQLDRKQGRVAVRVRTAAPLDEGQMEALRAKVARLTSGTPVLTVVTDPDLIGGLVVQIGDVVLDASVRNRLEQIRQRLIEGKTHEIQKRRDQFSHSA